MEVDGRRLDRFEAPRKNCAHAVVDGTGTAVVDHDVAKRRKAPALGEPEAFQGQLANETGGCGAHERRKVGLGHLVIERLVSNRGVAQRLEATVAIRQGIDAMARAGRCQRSAQAKRGDGPLAPTKLRRFAAGVEQRFRKHPLELVRDHAKVSVLHLGRLSLHPQQHTQEEFRMDHNKNPQ